MEIAAFQRQTVDFGRTQSNFTQGLNESTMATIATLDA
jgi:hypothetical protein